MGEAQTDKEFKSSTQPSCGELCELRSGFQWWVSEEIAPIALDNPLSLSSWRGSLGSIQTWESGDMHVLALLLTAWMTRAGGERSCSLLHLNGV